MPPQDLLFLNEGSNKQLNDYLDFKFRTGLMFAISVIWYEFLKLGRLHSNRMIGSVDVSDVPILQDSGFESRRSCMSCYFLFFLGSPHAYTRAVASSTWFTPHGPMHSCKQHEQHSIFPAMDPSRTFLPGPRKDLGKTQLRLNQS